MLIIQKRPKFERVLEGYTHCYVINFAESFKKKSDEIVLGDNYLKLGEATKSEKLSSREQSFM